MKKINLNINLALFLLVAGLILFSTACKKDDDMSYEKTRLFRPVLSEDLMAELNTIIINMGKIKEATSYTIEVSRDSFATVLYTIESDTNYVVLDEQTLNGNSLLWYTVYQIRATAHSADPTFDSKPSDLGEIRTERFPSILHIPTEGDILDVQARVSWDLIGAEVTKIRVFAGADELLETPLLEFDVDAAAQAAGEFFVSGLQPSTFYQIAIYSGDNADVLRGWEAYTTIASAIDLTDPNVIDLSQSEDPDALVNAIPTATDGQIIVLKKGVQYNLPSDPLDKSITITAAYGFGNQKAILFTTGNWNIAEGSNIDHIRFIDLELRGEDIGGDYVFNPNLSTMTTVNELTFDNCVINHFRGIIRIRSLMFLTNYNINNCIVHHIGGYGIITADTDGAGNAAFDNVALTNSTFNKIHVMFQTRQNAQSVLIDNCTFSEFADPDGIVFRWRGEAGVLSNVLNGITITNSIFGHAWDEGMTGNLAVRGIHSGLEATLFNVVNTYATSDFAFTPGSEIPGFPALNYGGTATDLWVDPYDAMDFHFNDSGFSGKNDSGDPRWRP